MKRPLPYLVLMLVAAGCFTLATVIQPRAAGWTGRAASGSVLKVLLGDGRRMFANHFFVQADVAFHSGYYPTIFDQVEKPKQMAMTQKHDHDEHAQSEHEKEMAFLGRPHDWIEAFGRNFRITEHTHLEQGKEREMLPWLRLSAELDPQRVDTYTVAAYWLRKRLGKVAEAEQFLREGLRNNPASYEIMYELGCLYAENKADLERARNLWSLALSRWDAQESKKNEPDFMALEQIAVHLANLEEQTGNFPRAVNLLELAKRASPNPPALQKRIDELKLKLNPARQ